MTAIVLDRMAIEEVGGNPARLAGAIHEQLGERPGPVPVHAIARALDIIDIREEPLLNLEGALLISGNRDAGSILANVSSGRRRVRFTVSHELGHFLNPWHKPTTPKGFRCRRADMWAIDLSEPDRHLHQEAEANAFAIELLAPRPRLHPYLRPEPDLGHVLAMAQELDISREAAGRRYADLHQEQIAVVFGKNGVLRYAVCSSDFPSLGVRRNMMLPALPAVHGRLGLSDQENADAGDWLTNPAGYGVTVQTLYQREGMATTLVRVVDEPDDYYEDSFDRLSGFSDR